ncbi:flippase [Thiomicrorhabdus heinhorstiae]|uniref:Flippase n=1 Tax=Thiomicrorhabdus heinhorstiae TaxID=2748010 RepID=A0ABS0BX18_9GAMM|nr:flippase [Thiomicrorhabdus heinhorstiae]MBF6057939.1 flippase [Thiomicrorhabdus heinhorstiae]
MTLKELLGKGIWTLVVRSLGAGLLFLSTLIFARFLGTEDFGLYSLALTIVTIMAVFTRVGLDNVLLKQVAAHLPDKPHVSSGYVFSSLKLTFYVGVFFTILIVVTSDLFAEYVFNKPEFSLPLRLFALSIFPMSIVFVMGEAFKGYGHPIFATALQSVLPPSVTLVIVGYLWFIDFLSLNLVIVSVVAGFLVSCIYFIYRWFLKIRFEQLERIRFVSLIQEGWPMLLISSGALVMAWSDVVILGIFSTSEEVGIYSAASRTVLVTSLILIAINSLTAPRYARFYKENNLQAIADLAHISSVILLAVVLLPTIVLFFFPEWVMGWFGSGYVSGSEMLMILAVGQMINVAFGSVGYLLSMTGKETKMRDIMLIAALINIVLSVLLVQKYDALGVSIATTVSVILWNTWAMIEVKRHLGFWTFNPVAIFSFNKKRSV